METPGFRRGEDVNVKCRFFSGSMLWEHFSLKGFEMDNIVNEDRKAWMSALAGTESGEFDVEKLREENSTPAVFTVPLGEYKGQLRNVIIDQSSFAHGAIVGCSGIGKSMALETLLCGLGVKYPPEVVEFVFASGKGPSSKASALPHTRADFNVSVESDATEFVEYVRDLVSERKSFAEEHELTLVTPSDLPAVFIVAEEVYAVQNPDFMGALEMVATCGRALGIHLVLVGQKFFSKVFPAGVVDNVGWVVAFRGFDDRFNVVEPVESLVGAKPGQGFVLTSSTAQAVKVFLLDAGEDAFLQSVTS